MPTLNAALVGYGYAGRTFHAPLLSHTAGFRLVAIVSSQHQQVAADYPSVRCFSDIDSLLDNGDIDLLVIATPNDCHYAHVRQALLAGCHVVVDKPFTTTVDEARQLSELAQQQQRILSVFHNRRWDADFLTVQALLAQATLGRVCHFESHFDRYRPQVRARWREQGGAGSGLWFDLGPHLVDQALQLFGMPDTLTADLAQQWDNAQSCDYFHVILGYAERRVILHGSCLVSGDAPRFILHGTLGSYRKSGLDTQESDLKRGILPGEGDWGIDPRTGIHFSLSDAGETTCTVPNHPGDYRAYFHALHACITRGAANPVSPEDAIRVMQILELAAASAQQGRRLEVPAR